MEAREFRSFECEWPEIARWLKGALARRGVPFNQIDDVVQETGCRLFGMWERVDMSRSTRALALAIATNFIWDERNRRLQPEPVEELPETASSNDVEAAGIARFELNRVKQALGDMNPHQQQVLLAEIGHAEPPEVSQAALKMLRHRARRRLTLILDSTSAGCLIFSLKIRGLSFRMQQAARRYATAMEAPTATAAAACAAAVTLSTTAMAASAPAKGNPVGATPSVIVSQYHHKQADRDGWVHVSRRDKSVAKRSVRKSTATPDNSIEGLEIRNNSGAGPAAGIYWHPENEGDKSLNLPACSTARPEDDSVRLSCTLDVGEEQHTLGVEVDLEP